MRVCDNCGSEVAPGDGFCGTCGAFLAWETDEEPTPPPAAPTPGPAPATVPTPRGPALPAPAGAAEPATPTNAPAPARTTGPDPNDPADPDGRERSGDRVDPAGSDGSGTPGGPQEATDPDEPPTEPRQTARVDLGRAAALVVPVRPATEPERPRDTAEEPAEVFRAAPDQPGAVQPGRPVVAAPVVRDFTGDRVGEPTDLTCVNCGTANPVGRSFCRRCGRPLAEAAPARASVPWWRRLRWPRRRGGAGWLRRLPAVLLVLALLVGVAWAVVRFGGPLVETVRDRTATPEAILPATVTASSAARGHPARSAVDGLNNRYWAPATDREPTGEYLELTFDPPIRLLDLIVHTGASPRQDDFVRQARPAELTMTLWTAQGAERSLPLRLTDRPGPQSFHHPAGEVTRLRLTIAAGYGVQEGRRVALAEVEVFRRP